MPASFALDQVEWAVDYGRDVMLVSAVNFL
jgi:hypothetical protein